MKCVRRDLLCDTGITSRSTISETEPTYFQVHYSLLLSGPTQNTQQPRDISLRDQSNSTAKALVPPIPPMPLEILGLFERQDRHPPPPLSEQIRMETNELNVRIYVFSHPPMSG